MALNALELANKDWGRRIPKDFFEHKKDAVAQADADDLDRVAERMAANMKEERIRQGVESRSSYVITERKLHNANAADAASK